MTIQDLPNHRSLVLILLADPAMTGALSDALVALAPRIQPLPYRRAAGPDRIRVGLAPPDRLG